MDDMQLLIDLHKDGYRQGPGSDAATELAINIALIDLSFPWRHTVWGGSDPVSTVAGRWPPIR